MILPVRPGTITLDVPDSPSAPIPVLLGYADRFSVAPGETIRFMVSCEAPSYRARLVRLIHGDSNPAGPGYKEESFASSFDRTIPGRRQTIAAGSYVRVPLATALDLSAGFTVQAWIWPTTPAKPGGQGLVACWSSNEPGGFTFGLDDDGRLYLELALGSVVARVTHTAQPLARGRWAFVAASHDARSGTVRLYQASAEPYGVSELAIHEERLDQGSPVCLQRDDLLIAARAADNSQVLAAYNGKIDRPRLFGRALGPQELRSRAPWRRACRLALWAPGTLPPT